jgi:hypothetical protein
MKTLRVPRSDAARSTGCCGKVLHVTVNILQLDSLHHGCAGNWPLPDVSGGGLTPFLRWVAVMTAY